MRINFINRYFEMEGFESAEVKNETALTTFHWVSNKKPPYNKYLILVTNKGQTIGKLVSTDHVGDHYQYLEESSDVYYSSSRVIKWAYIPECPSKF